MDIVTREEWGAKPPRWGPYSMAVPTGELWLHHSAGSGSDATAVRAIQDFHQGPDRNWSDIAYSFLIDDDEDPQVFEGRGAAVVGGHTKDHNSRSHAICIIGNFSSKLPKPATIDRLVELVIHGWEQRWWSEPKITGGHRDARLNDGSFPGTECPGDALYALIDQINDTIRTRLYPLEDLLIMLPITPSSPKSDIAYLQRLFDEAGVRVLTGDDPDTPGVWGERTTAAVTTISPNQAIEGQELGRLVGMVAAHQARVAVGAHAAAANHSGGTLPATFTARLEVIS